MKQPVQPNILEKEKTNPMSGKGNGKGFSPKNKTAKLVVRMGWTRQKLPQLWRLFRRKSASLLKSALDLTPAVANGKFRDLRLKTKIRLVLLALFFVVTLLGVLGGYYVQRTSTNSLLMLQENYQAIKYTRDMSKAVNDMIAILVLENTAPAYRNQQLRMASDEFERNLNMQLNKITAKEEQELTEQLKQDFERFRDTLMRVNSTKEVSTDIYMQKNYIEDMLKTVYNMNDKMIQQRTLEANKIANKVTMGMVILGTLFFLFAVIAMFYFPSYVAEPIQSMTESIRQIARKI